MQSSFYSPLFVHCCVTDSVDLAEMNIDKLFDKVYILVCVLKHNY